MKDYIHQFAKSRGLTLTGLANALDYASPTSLFRLMHANVRKKSIQDFLQRMTCCLTLTDQERDALFFAVDSKLEGETYARQNRSVRRFMSVASPETPPLLLLQPDGTPLASVSVGVAFGDRLAPGGDLFKEADTALYEVKGTGRRGCKIAGESGGTV